MVNEFETKKKEGRRSKTIAEERKVVPPARTTTSPRIAYETLGNKVGNPATEGCIPATNRCYVTKFH